MMTGRRIDSEIIAEIERLLRAQDLSGRQIAKTTMVSRPVVEGLRSGKRAANAAKREAAAAKRRMEAPLLAKPYLRCECGARARRPFGSDACLACGLRQGQRQGTPDEDVLLGTDLQDEHLERYEEMRILAKVRHEKKSQGGS